MKIENVKIILKRKEELKGATLLTGFHGVGFVGHITIKHLVSALGAKLIGYIETLHMPPYVGMREDGRVQTPFEIYKARLGDSDIILVLTEIPLNSRDTQDFAFTLSEWSVKEGFEEALLVGGLDVRLKKSDEDEVRCVTTSAYLRKYGREGIGFLEKGYYVVGPLALMLAKYEMMDFPAIAILPYASIERPDPRAAAVAIKYIGRHFGVQINTKRLIEEAEVIEKELEEISRKSMERAEREIRSLYV
ncbi:MAG: proteasome assembly chaperone family protein [Thermoprotei archaeon]|nr:proteasome assembly chaperone family protein [Thermoprotei archaeon]